MKPKRSNKSIGRKKKPCPLKQAGILEVSPLDIDLLTQFLTRYGKLIARRNTGLCLEMHKKLEKAVKQSRSLGLIAYTFQD